MSPISLLFHLHAALAAPQDEYNGLIQQSLREQEVEDICTRLKMNYAGWPLKKRITQGEGFLRNPDAQKASLPVADGEKICKHFAQLEKDKKDPELKDLSIEDRKFRIAKSNLEYSDRLKSLIAAFRDSHLTIWRSAQRVEIFYGFDLKEIDGRYYISDLHPARNFVWSEALGENAPKVGDEVVSWNGEKIESVLKRLMKHVAGSTERAIRVRALAALTKRRFSYPDTASLKIEYISLGESEERSATAILNYDKFSSTEAVDPRFYTSNVASHPDDLVYLNRIGALNYQDVNIQKKPEGDRHRVKPMFRISEVSEQRNELAGNLKEWIRYCNNEDETIAITGRLKDDPSVGYLKITGFLDSSWSVSSTGNVDCGYGKSVSEGDSDLKEHLARFLRGFADSSMPKIILDLRHNGGGSPANVRKLVSLFLKTGDSAKQSFDYQFFSHRTVEIGSSFMNPELKFETPDFDQDTLKSWRTRFQSEREFSQTAEEGGRIFISPGLAARNIESSDVFRSNPEVLVWTGPFCVSGCEQAIMDLSDNRLGRVAGAPTAGTGMGMHSKGILDTMFTTLSGTHQIPQVPNYFFGRPNVDSSCESASLATHTPAQILECRIQGISENRPAKIDLPYEETLEDLLKNGKGWIDRSIEYFSQSTKDPANRSSSSVDGQAPAPTSVPGEPSAPVKW